MLCFAALARSLARSLGSVRFGAGAGAGAGALAALSLGECYIRASNPGRSIQNLTPSHYAVSLRTQVLSRGAFRPTFIPALDMSDAWTKPDPYLHEDTAEGDPPPTR